ncbi:hypothetical protein A3H81_00410 [Candidatus Daviesbacteria bacterium RIFCSPLOWO2_02_FULL_38_18]|nr:MAG: hypothetical protein A3H81_00410 [Candidatus Daviesbacteria bacterium RIFCSPLOWO2_02_FULL_38_18]HCB23204.1 hypothetical protein [Candidatus Daviesbacteria bacterium]
MFMNTQNKIALIVIILLAVSLRFFKLSEVPPAISWDEAAVGYNAWTIANFGQDEYGNGFPLMFKSFGEYKNPVDIYATALSVKLFGLSEFSTRLPVALFGVFNVILLFFLTKALLNNNLIALAAAFFLSISPMNIHFSHFNHEANLALFFFMLGFYLFMLTIKGKKFLLFAFICFILSFFSYNAPKMFIPVFIFFLIVIYRKELLKLSGQQLFFSICLIVFFSFILFLNPHALGIDRAAQTISFKLNKNELFGQINLVAAQYSLHFLPDFLIIRGDKNPRLSAQVTGEFYYLDIVFLIAGVIFIFRKRSKELLILFLWAFIAPLPSSITAEAPHAGRAMFMMGSWQIISAIGFYSVISLFRKKAFKLTVIIICLVIFGFSSFNFLSYYFGEYNKRYAIEWQYGMKQIVEFVKLHPEYHVVYMTDVRDQPYIFFLYYLKTLLPDYLQSVTYNKEESKSHNNVFFFDKYFFGGWNSVESMPQRNVLYVFTPSQYDGLRYKLQFDIKEIIYYPNETVAFYLVSIK